MSTSGFTLQDAARLLHEVGQLEGIYLAAERRLVLPDEGRDFSDLASHSFRGAGLDNRALAPGELFVALMGEHSDGRTYVPQALAEGHWALTRSQPGANEWAEVTGAGGVLLSPDPDAALQVLAGAWRARFSYPVVGITGSNGKTTTKDFLAAALSGAGSVCATRGNLNNRLGLPLTLLRLGSEHQFAVMEMGASAVGHIASLVALARPDIALITNAGQAHLAEFGSLQGVIQGKGEILDLLPAQGRAILNADSPGFAEWCDRAPCPVVSYGLDQGDYLWSWIASGRSGQSEVLLNGQTWPVPLPGRHNGANLVAAILAARASGLTDEQMRQGLDGFVASSHRSDLRQMGGRSILDDSYNANPSSMLAACSAIARLPGHGRALAVLGHMAELGPDSEQLHREVGQSICEAGVDQLLAVGPGARNLAEGFHGKNAPAFQVDSVGAAADWLDEHSGPGDRILIKGSRSAAMDQLVDLLDQRWPQAGEDA
nr:UDP-N-acetylmuramoyl-tripeptide--D-alanyl-D-alanine ligase [Candidatus Krumholzibacteria bacterium]